MAVTIGLGHLTLTTSMDIVFTQQGTSLVGPIEEQQILEFSRPGRITETTMEELKRYMN
jgi:hypothetical protein